MQKGPRAHAHCWVGYFPIDYPKNLTKPSSPSEGENSPRPKPAKPSDRIHSVMCHAHQTSVRASISQRQIHRYLTSVHTYDGTPPERDLSIFESSTEVHTSLSPLTSRISNDGCSSAS